MQPDDDPGAESNVLDIEALMASLGPTGADLPRDLMQHPDLYDHDALTVDVDDTATAAPESRASVRQRLRALLDTIRQGSDVDHGAGPRGPVAALVVPPGITLDAALAGTLAAPEVQALLRDPVNTSIVQYLTARRELNPPGGLTEAVREISALRDEFLANQQVPLADQAHAEVARQLIADQGQLTRLAGLVGDPSLDLPLPQAAALMRFLDAYPGFWANLTRHSPGFRFNSAMADSRGGAVYDNTGDRAIHISRLTTTPAGAFVRLLVHETGHATFEPILLGGRPIPIPLNTDDLSRVLATLDGDAAVDESALRNDASSCTIADGYWAGTLPAARSYYRAWLVLRANHGARLLGMDLWQDPQAHRLSPEQRLPYQAERFSEFCAETFMLYAIGDLRPHIDTALAGDATPALVKTAWRNVWTVLEEVASPILGPRVG